MPYCSNCGTQNSETAKFCINCGAALQKVTTEQKPIQQSSPSSLPPQQLSIGSKVSFVAGDGKAYTGTVKEIQGDQYKIKYDGFDFETWLNKNQFTMIVGNTTQPVYTPVTNPQVIVTNTSTSPSTTSTAPAFITHLGFWGSLMIIIGFFTNWLNVGYYGSFSGLKILTSLSEVMGGEKDQDKMGLLMVVAIAVIIISAIICFFYSIGAGIGKGAFSFFKILPLLAIIAFVAYIIIKSQDSYRDYENDGSASAWRIFGIGIYLTLIGSLVLAISRSRK